MREYIKTSKFLTEFRDSSCQYPAIASDDNNNRTFVVWQSYENHKENLIYNELENNEVVNEFVLSDTGLTLRANIHYFKDQVAVVWSEFINKQWSIRLRIKNNNAWSEIISIIEGDALFYPYISDNGKDFVIVFAHQRAKHSDIIFYNCGTQCFEKVNTIEKCYRPTYVKDNNDTEFVVYDCFNGTSYDVVIRAKKDNQWSDEKVISQSKYRCAQPIIGLSKDKKVVGWYENGPKSYFSYNVIDVEFKNGQFELSNYHVLVENRNWYNNVFLTSNNIGDVVFAYTIGKTNIVCRTRGENGIWTNAALLSLDDTNCAIRPQLALDDDKKLSYVWQYSMRNGHQQRNAQIVYNQVNLEELVNYNDNEIEIKVDNFVQPIKNEKKIDLISEEEKQQWLSENNIKENIYFGDIHGQSNMSDGQGEIDQYYHYAKLDAHLDFCALTDHDCYPDVASDSEWEWNRATRDVFNGEEDFSAILAFEWTSNEYKHDFGHKNVYYPDSEGSLFTSVDPNSLNPDRLYSSIKEEGGLCIPHHPAADWGMVSAATDWDYHDDEVERLVEIFSRHANYEKTEDASLFTKNISKFDDHCIQDALKRGYHLGFTAGSDSHQMEHGIEGGIVAIYSDENESKKLWNNLYNRHTYATTGSRILLNFTANGVPMGSEIKVDENIKFKISVLGTDKIKKIEIIKNNQVIFYLNPKEKKVNTFFECKKDECESYYYLRVEQFDNHIAWSSPIWIK